MNIVLLLGKNTVILLWIDWVHMRIPISLCPCSVTLQFWICHTGPGRSHASAPRYRIWDCLLSKPLLRTHLLTKVHIVALPLLLMLLVGDVHQPLAVVVHIPLHRHILTHRHYLLVAAQALTLSLEGTKIVPLLNNSEVPPKRMLLLFGELGCGVHSP